jgi:Na+-transporting methylmalonyl-CoA/oxaloacetate decarboxylase gamma subunit
MRGPDVADLNRNLVLFAFFLIVLGVGLDFYLISFFGLLVLIPAFMAPSRTAPRPVPAPAKPEVRRIGPPPKPRPTAEQAQPEVQPQTTTTLPASQQLGPALAYSPALFPNSLFPPMSLSGSPAAPPAELAAKKTPERDELVEAGALLAFFKLFFG